LCHESGGALGVPTISHFFGITIRMYYDDHGPPHFHAYYQHHAASIEIGTLQLTAGTLPRRAMALVLEWAAIHRAILLEDWRLAEAHEALRPIEPLE
jgi:hypothetical protein